MSLWKKIVFYYIYLQILCFYAILFGYEKHDYWPRHEKGRIGGGRLKGFNLEQRIRLDEARIIGIPNQIKNGHHANLRRRRSVLKRVEHSWETSNKPICGHADSSLPDKIQVRYKYSSYLINPFKYRFQVVIRVMAIMLKFIKRLRSSKPHLTQPSSIKSPAAIFFQMKKSTAARRISSGRHLRKWSTSTNQHSTKNISTEQDGILMYTGRILPSENVTVVGKTTSVMKDLCSTSFCTLQLLTVSLTRYIGTVKWSEAPRSWNSMATRFENRIHHRRKRDSQEDW